MKEQAKVSKKRTIAAIVRAGIMSGKSPEAIRSDVARVYPKSAMAKAPAEELPSRVSWFRAKLRAEGIKVPSPKKVKKAKAPRPQSAVAPARRAAA